MSNVITETQKKVIEKLAVNYSDVLIAYGADMYRKGMINGAIAASIGAFTAVTISTISKKVIEIKKSQRSEYES